MTNPPPHGQVPEALIDLIDAYAETRHRYGRIHNAKTESARKAVIEALSGVQALSAAPVAFLKSVIALCSHRGYSPANIEVWDKDDKWIADLWRQAESMLTASPTPPAEQQAQPGAVGRTGCTAGTDEECTRRGCATSCPAQQAAPKAAPMSPINRVIAYSAATKLIELGFAWDEEAEAWLNSAAPQPAPALLSDEELCQIEEPYLLNFRIPLGGQYDFARAVEKAVICKMGKAHAPQGETNVQLDIDSNHSAPGQQRDVARSVALGQPMGNGQDQAAGHPSAQGDKLLTVAERNIRSFLRSATLKSESDREAALNCVDVLWEAARAAESVPAVEREQERMTALHKPAVDKAWGQFQSAMAAPQQEAKEPVVIYHGRCTIDCGEHGHHDMEMLRMIPSGSKLYTAPQPAPAPLSDDVVKDAARWRMAALIGNEVMLHPDKRTHATAVKAYMDATHSGSDLTGAVDAALAAQGGKT